MLAWHCDIAALALINRGFDLGDRGFGFQDRGFGLSVVALALMVCPGYDISKPRKNAKLFH